MGIKNKSQVFISGKGYNKMRYCQLMLVGSVSVLYRYYLLDVIYSAIEQLFLFWLNWDIGHCRRIRHQMMLGLIL